MLKHSFSIKSKCLTIFPKNAYTLAHPRRKPTAYDLERLAYKRLSKKYHANNIKLYWERQTEIENEFIGNFIFWLFFNSLMLINFKIIIMLNKRKNSKMI